MLAHRLDNAVAGTVLAIGIMVAASAVLWKAQTPPHSVGIKGDRLEIAPQVGCSYAAWPYGCDWQLRASPEPPRRSKFGRRGRHHQMLPHSSS
jgi:hypothetical protein